MIYAKVKVCQVEMLQDAARAGIALTRRHESLHEPRPEHPAHTALASPTPDVRHFGPSRARSAREAGGRVGRRTHWSWRKQAIEAVRAQPLRAQQGPCASRAPGARAGRRGVGSGTGRPVDRPVAGTRLCWSGLGRPALRRADHGRRGQVCAASPRAVEAEGLRAAPLRVPRHSRHRGRAADAALCYPLDSWMIVLPSTPRPNHAGLRGPTYCTAYMRMCVHGQRWPEEDLSPTKLRPGTKAQAQTTAAAATAAAARRRRRSHGPWWPRGGRLARREARWLPAAVPSCAGPTRNGAWEGS